MQEGSADQVAGGAVAVLDAALSDASPGELFQFPECEGGRFPVSLNNPSVIHRDGEDGDGLGRRALKVEEDASFLSGQLRQSLA